MKRTAVIRLPGTRVVALLLLTVTALSPSCGIPTDESPLTLPPTAVPSPTVTETAQTPREATIYLLDQEDRLVRVTREIDPERAIESLIGALAQEPTEAEQAQGYVSAVPPTAVVLSVRKTAEGLWTIDLGGFLDAAGDAQAQVRPLAQIVYTVTELDAVDRLLFLFDGQRSNVPSDSGELEPDTPVSTLDYMTYAPIG